MDYSQARAWIKAFSSAIELNWPAERWLTVRRTTVR
jgi:hypothetical protein